MATKIDIAINPTLFSALGQSSQAAKAQRAVVRDLQREVRGVARSGQQVSAELAERLRKAQEDLSRLEQIRDSANAGRSGRGAGLIKKGFESGEGSFATTGAIIEGIHHAVRFGGKAGHFLSDLQRGRGGGLNAYADAASLVARFTPPIVGAALHVLSESLRATAETYDEDKSVIEARTTLNKAANKWAAATGIRVSIPKLAADFKSEATTKLDTEGKLHGMFAQALGLTNDSLIEKQALEDAHKAVEEVLPHLEGALKAAGLGDIARATREQTEATTASLGSGEIQRFINNQGSPMTMYWRQEQARFASKQYSRWQSTRPKMRTGEYE